MAHSWQGQGATELWCLGRCVGFVSKGRMMRLGCCTTAGYNCMDGRVDAQSNPTCTQSLGAQKLNAGAPFNSVAPGKSYWPVAQASMLRSTWCHIMTVPAPWHSSSMAIRW